jgi:hypothetical protein
MDKLEEAQARAREKATGKKPVLVKKTMAEKKYAPGTKFTTGNKPVHRFRSGTQALREMKRLMHSSGAILKRAGLLRTIREAIVANSDHGWRLTPQAVCNVGDVLESFIIQNTQNAVDLQVGLSQASHTRKDAAYQGAKSTRSRQKNQVTQGKHIYAAFRAWAKNTHHGDLLVDMHNLAPETVTLYERPGFAMAH